MRLQMTTERMWMPEIMYEEDARGVAQAIPFIQVPKDEEMPKFLLIWAYTDTGEVEPGPKGEEMPIVESELKQYAQMDVLKAKLSREDYDKVRVALGLENLSSATRKGQEITSRAVVNASLKVEE